MFSPLFDLVDHSILNEYIFFCRFLNWALANQTELLLVDRDLAFDLGDLFILLLQF